MSTKLKVYTNEDDALLFWSIAEPIERCRGFAIERRRKDSEGKEMEDFLPNRMGFENEKVAVKPEEGQEVVMKPSTEWPFQRFRGLTTIQIPEIPSPTKRSRSFGMTLGSSNCWKHMLVIGVSQDC